LPASDLGRLARIAGGRIAIGGQDCHTEVSGHHTGDISAEMLKDAGASAVIAGHSERRWYYGEFDALVAAKAGATRRAGLFAIVCVGEMESQRSAGDGRSICGDQIVASVPTGMTEADLAMGYEPIWAIGSGRVPTSQEIRQMHAHIRKCLLVHLGPHGKNVRILYGSSVNPTDARAILALPGVGAALVGGAKLKTEGFWAILASTPSTSTLRLDVA
jgi:triosephosphate isomerase